MVNFRILHGGSKALSRIKTLDFRKGNIGLFKDLLGGIPWVRTLKVGGSKRAGRCLNINSSLLRFGASP